ncbi:FG-GAP repeat domain-containing protein [Singulisphaera sp. PoT]|uniref:FG-GAP repeat domain-containing protein n=1 Tax=Singulisphaera sp. PoT TaxID=3411797 RepID=UPI003BF4D0E5
MRHPRSVLIPFAVVLSTALTPSRSKALDFDRVVIDATFAGVDQVELADVNGDGRLDVVAVGAGTCAWYENPSWKKRIVTTPKQTPRIVSSATADVDCDGKSEIAIAYDFVKDDPSRGRLLLAKPGKEFDDPWKLEEVGKIGSIHRLRWFYRLRLAANSVGFIRILPGPNLKDAGEGSNAFTLLVAPLYGPSAKPPAFDQESANLVTLNFGRREQPKPGLGGGGVGGLGGTVGFAGGLGGLGGGSVPINPTDSLYVDSVPSGVPHGFSIGTAPGLNAIDLVDLEGYGVPVVLAASQLGVTRHSLAGIAGVPRYVKETLVSGAAGKAPLKGASEVRGGRLKDGRRFLVTIEPGNNAEVAAYLSEPKGTKSRTLLKFGPRTSVDATLKEAEALCVADVDGDGDDEVFAGSRAAGEGVVMYDFDGKTWSRSVVDASIGAHDVSGGDLDKDGKPDVVAADGKADSILWYKARAGSSPR